MKKSDEYTPIHGLFRLLQATNNGAAEGTGVKLLVEQGHALLGPKIPSVMIDYVMGRQVNLFGDYPKSSDMAPSIIFAVVFFVLALLHLLIFTLNTSRKHYFWLTLGFLLTCLMRVVGWACRAYWSTDLTMVPPGIADEVFLVIPSILLVSFNLILAQRIFTWRHPVGGSRPLFWNTMFLLYGVVVLVIVMTIIASAVPYVYLLSEHAYMGYKKTVEASAILIMLYTLTAVSLLGLAYFFKPTRKDENLYTYQPWWIESFSPFYFVKPGAKEEAEQSFMKRGHNHRHAIRVIAATHHHHNMVEGLSRERGDLKHNWSLVIITLTTIFIFIGQLGRTVAVFQGRYQIDSGPVCKPVAMYICWGLFEVIINLLYIIGRVDLRFYRPDRLPAPVRSIITAEQSLNPSDVESESMQSAEDDYSDSETQFNASEKEFGFNNSPLEKVRGDDESEFHF